MTAPSEIYEFDNDVQTQVLGYMFRDVAFNVRTEGLVKPQYFESEVHAVLANMAMEYYRNYRTVPSKASLSVLLKEAVDKKLIRDDLKGDVRDTLKTVYDQALTDLDFTVEQVAKFAKRQALTEAIIKCAGLIDKGDYDAVEPIMAKAQLVGANLDEGQYDFFGEAEHRFKYREAVLAGAIKATGITTGWKKFDDVLYHKGWGRKELSVIMAPAKAGKSMSLITFGMKAVMAGYNVLFVSLEVATKIVADRLDANMASVPMNDLAMQLKKAKDTAHLVAAKSGVLKIHDFASGTFTPGDLRRLIHRYAAVGTKFDLIIVDYADLMAPDRVNDEARENSRQIYLGLRAIAHEFDAAVLSATQTNREGFKAKQGEMHHVAEDINKVRTVDLLLSLNPQDDGKHSNIYLAASRNQASATIKVKTNLAMAKFVEDVIEVVE
jgi:replicative DNA helicase